MLYEVITVRVERGDRFFRFLGDRSFSVVGHEDGTLIAVATVAKLPAGIKGIDVPPVVVEQLPVADLLRIVGDEDRNNFV